MAAIVSAINNNLQNWASFFRISQSYLKRKNPVLNAMKNTLMSIQNFLSTQQRLKVLKYRVQLMNYRIYQMEQLIKQNNPYNQSGGNNLNHLR